MSKTSAKTNRVNKDQGKHPVGSEPGQEQLHERLDRQDTGVGPGTRSKSRNQGREGGEGQRATATREKGDARRARRK